jgi:hypothetical protein
MFRADSARYAGDPDFERLIATLMKASSEFRKWWPRHEVLHLLSSQKRIQHKTAGRMVFEYTSFAVSDHSDMKLVVYTPLEEAQTVEKLEALLREAKPSERSRVTVAKRPRQRLRRGAVA